MTSATSAEDIYILRSIREPAQTTSAEFCSSSRIGFEPFPTDAERYFSFWSLQSRAEDGKIIEAKAARVAELHACFGATDERARHNFYAEIRLGGVGPSSIRGKGECLALDINFPEQGLFPVRCQLILSAGGGGGEEYAGGLLTTNTITTKASFGAESDPPGYTQASIATIRLWRKKKGQTHK